MSQTLKRPWRQTRFLLSVFDGEALGGVLLLAAGGTPSVTRRVWNPIKRLVIKTLFNMMAAAPFLRWLMCLFPVVRPRPVLFLKLFPRGTECPAAGGVIFTTETKIACFMSPNVFVLLNWTFSKTQLEPQLANSGSSLLPFFIWDLFHV